MVSNQRRGAERIAESTLPRTFRDVLSLLRRLDARRRMPANAGIALVRRAFFLPCGGGVDRGKALSGRGGQAQRRGTSDPCKPGIGNPPGRRSRRGRSSPCESVPVHASMVRRIDRREQCAIRQGADNANRS
jgi:hypothetical protein